MKILIDNGADINHKPENGETPLIVVAGQGKRNECPFHIQYCVLRKELQQSMDAVSFY